ncbi:glycosyltransferase family 9 protein [Gramella jeungdoensis]|uniref:Glycosyltransferase family 9 protein n=1 Tax=Gramella jeungdoensis TaxID=708091 RepID=A0ABT0YYG4_9FLAO|nr:glycosyltransferase family 9 protein [Gramella jeungdoensis]MCM8568168.1 glycosyltransferase family 9 protein [Gramella jeungdoensis]
MKILVIQQKMIGDVLVSSILVSNLRQAYPNAQIDYMVYESTTPVLQGNKDFDNLILFKPEHRKNKMAFFRLLKAIRKENYDVVIDAYAKLESYLISTFSGAGKRITYKKTITDILYTDTVEREDNPDSEIGLIIEHRLALLKPLNLNVELETRPKLQVTEEEKNYARELFKKNGIDNSKMTIMLSIIGSMDTKTYPFEYMSQLIDHIASKGEMNLLFNYIPSQKEQAKQLLSMCKESTREKVYFDVLGKSLREFIAIMNQCDMIIGNDGGAINMAKALGKPSFILFSPWIDKKGWATFEDGVNNISLHLKDFRAEAFENKSASEIKKETFELYRQFTPELIIPALSEFLKTHLKT